MTARMYELYKAQAVLNDLEQIRMECTSHSLVDDPVMVFENKTEAVEYFRSVYSRIEVTTDGDYEVTEYRLITDDAVMISKPRLYILEEGSRFNTLYGAFDNGTDAAHALMEIQNVVAGDECTTNRFSRSVSIVFEIPEGFRGAIVPYSEADMNLIRRNATRK